MSDSLLKEYRMVLRVASYDSSLKIKRGQKNVNLILGKLLAGSDVEVIEFGPPLDHGERDRADFRKILVEKIREKADFVQEMFGREYDPTHESPRPSRRELKERGELIGLLDAYRLLTGLPTRSLLDTASGVARHARTILKDGKD